MRAAFVGLVGLLGASTAEATPQSALGGGVGFVSLLHVDCRRWFDPQTSVALGVTPLLFLNVGTVSLTRQVPLGGDDGAGHALALSLTGTGIYGIMDGSPAVGVGGRVAYEWWGERMGVSLGGGPLLLRTSGGSTGLELAPAGRLTVWRLKRRTTPAP